MSLYMILSLMFATSIAKPNEPFCVPDQFEGYLESSTLFNLGPGKSDLVTASETLAFDFTGQRLAANYSGTYAKSGQKVQMRILQNFVTKLTYTVTGGVCHVAPNQAAMDHCVPANATEVPGHRIGAMGSGLDIVDWVWNTTDVPPVEHVLSTVKGTNIPYVLGATQLSKTASYSVFGSYNRITLGIKDSSVFNIPPECKSMKKYPNAESLPDHIQHAHSVHKWFLK